MTTNASTKWLMVLAALALSACGAETDTGRGEPSVIGMAGAGGTGATMPTGLDPMGNPLPGTMAGAGGTGTQTSGQPAGTPIPCNVADTVAANCGTCHGAAPIGGAIRLVTHEDWHQASPYYGGTKLGDPAMKVYQVAKVRIENKEMPQMGTLSEPDFATLDAWFTGGAVAGTAADAECSPSMIDPGTIVPAGPQEEVYCDRPGGRDPLVARPGETCYEFVKHGANGVADTSKFPVGIGQIYDELYYDIPWKAGDVMTRFGADFDNEAVLHHYLLFSSHAGAAPGTVLKAVSGTTIGTNATLIAGWAVGGCGQEYPEVVGMELPAPGDGKIMIQWHHFNSTGAVAMDASIVQVCTVPAGTRPNIGDVSHLGTENFNGLFGMPPGPNNFTTQCTNNSGADAFVVGWMPHMHLLGTNMKTVLKRADGSMETVFDKPFKFDYQIGYAQDPPLKVGAGETLITTCSFVNTTGANVAFGQKTESEMCYQFASYYPVGSLINGTPSLLGSTNTCW